MSSANTRRHREIARARKAVTNPGTQYEGTPYKKYWRSGGQPCWVITYDTLRKGDLVRVRGTGGVQSGLYLIKSNSTRSTGRRTQLAILAREGK